MGNNTYARFSGINEKRKNISTTTRKHIWELDGGHCVYCGHKLLEVDYPSLLPGYQVPDMSKRLPTIDHWIPVSLGGTNVHRNMFICCSDCNHKKGQLDPRIHTIWMPKHGNRDYPKLMQENCDYYKPLPVETGEPYEPHTRRLAKPIEKPAPPKEKEYPHWVIKSYDDLKNLIAPHVKKGKCVYCSRTHKNIGHNFHESWCPKNPDGGWVQMPEDEIGDYILDQLYPWRYKLDTVIKEILDSQD